MILTDELTQMQEEVEARALEYGLDFFTTIFEVLDYAAMNEVVAYDGFPTRYPHWRFGMAYEEIQKSHAYGLRHIYEIVINNDPCYAYLLNSNTLLDQKLVMAHVFAHADFFKMNHWFSQTNRKMVDEMANHSARIRRYSNRFGREEVEDFIDKALSLEDLIDPHSLFIRRRDEEPDPLAHPNGTKATPSRLPSKGYMDSYINPPDFLEAQQKALEEKEDPKRKFPFEPERDVLLFLIEYAPLENWQQDFLFMLREEMYYFAPQRQTKIMNEGWATYWHSKMMTGQGEKPPLLKDSEVITYADRHSGTVGTQPGVLNPYKMGLELFRDIEERWNKGKFGADYDDCDDLREREKWDLDLGRGREKIFDVRKTHNDVTFIDTFLTPEFCWEQKLFAFDYNKCSSRYEISDREFNKIKSKLLFQLTNAGQPFIFVENGNHNNRGELLLVHRHDGFDLDLESAKSTLENVQHIWGRPVHISTQVEEKEKTLSFDGNAHSESS
jgi:stage V sporulation protein R